MEAIDGFFEAIIGKVMEKKIAIYLHYLNQPAPNPWRLILNMLYSLT